MEGSSSALLAIAGCYGQNSSGGSAPAGLHVMTGDPGSERFVVRAAVAAGLEAGFLVASPNRSNIYVVNERKNDGRGPVGPLASVQSWALDPTTGALEQTGSQPVLGPFPTYLSLDPAGKWLAVASHGSFDHVERVVRSAEGLEIVNVYDDSTVSLFRLEPDGRLGGLADLVVLTGHGPDPNPSSSQAGGHPQASPHAHCAQFDPSGRFLVVCDKGTDRIHVYRLDAVRGRLDEVHVFQAEPGVAPRHAAFHPNGEILVVSNELASTISSFRFDAETGEIIELSSVTSLAPGGSRPNEPADIQVHPGGNLVYVNNRGQDSLVGFRLDRTTGELVYACHVRLADSVHPGLAARSFRFDPSGRHLLVADRPADAVINFQVDPASGSLEEISRTTVPQPAFVLVV